LNGLRKMVRSEEGKRYAATLAAPLAIEANRYAAQARGLARVHVPQVATEQRPQPLQTLPHAGRDLCGRLNAVLENNEQPSDLSLEPAAVEQFTFERGEEAFAHRIVEAIFD